MDKSQQYSTPTPTATSAETTVFCYLCKTKHKDAIIAENLVEEIQKLCLIAFTNTTRKTSVRLQKQDTVCMTVFLLVCATGLPGSRYDLVLRYPPDSWSRRSLRRMKNGCKHSLVKAIGYFSG